MMMKNILIITNFVLDLSTICVYNVDIRSRYFREPPNENRNTRGRKA